MNPRLRNGFSRKACPRVLLHRESLIKYGIACRHGVDINETREEKAMSSIKTALYSKFVVVKALAWLSAVVIWSHLAIAQSGGEVELAAPADEFKASEKLAIEFGGATGEITYYNTRGKAIIEGD